MTINSKSLGDELILTPAFVIDESKLLHSLQFIDPLRIKTDCKILFSLKSFSIITGLNLLVSFVDGFSASSIYEAKLSREILGVNKVVHFTTPGLKAEEIIVISELCDHLSFNSFSQWERLYKKVAANASCGLRVNPQISYVNDERYDPCRKGSKLGVPINQLVNIIKQKPKSLKDLKGLHFHTNCESKDFNQLFTTVKQIESHLPMLLGQLDWVNIGGGYLFENSANLEKLVEAIVFLKEKYYVDVYFEPGKGIIGSAAFIFSTVIDLFENDGHKIAILDTSVNHMPEVFEYQFRPNILQESEGGQYKYTLAGATCLAGDLFGEYKLDEPLQIGSQIVFENMGAYTMVKSHMFNGVNLPTIYSYTQDRKIELIKKFDYNDFKSRCGAN